MSDMTTIPGSSDVISKIEKFNCIFCLQIIDNAINTDVKPAATGDDEAGGDGEGGAAVSQETLISGLVIFSQALLLDISVGKKGVGGVISAMKNVKIDQVCCDRCLTFMKELDTIREKINLLETSKMGIISHLQTLIVESQTSAEVSQDGHLKMFSRFREQVSKCPLPTTSEGQPFAIDKSQPVINSVEPSSNEMREDHNVGSPDMLAQYPDIEQPYVKLERIDIPDENDCEVDFNFENDNLSSGNANSESVSSPSPPPSCDDPSDSSASSEEEFEEYKLKRRRVLTGTRGGKRGRPRTRIVNALALVKRKRGRPRTRVESVIVKRTRGRPRTRIESTPTVPIENSESTDGKRKRGRPRKTDDGIDGPKRPRATSPTDEPPNAPPRLSRKMKEDGPSFKPIYVIDPSNGVYMCLGVKFRTTPTAFHCEHPNCTHETRFVGHFTQQIVFHEMRFHIQQHHRGGTNQYKVNGEEKHYFFCCHCHLQLGSRAELIEHRKKEHSGIPMPLALCEVCGFTVADKELIDHVLTHKSEEEKHFITNLVANKRQYVSRPLHFPCDQCERVYPNPTQLRLHRITHLSSETRKQHVCDLCGEVVMSENTLKLHITRVHFKHKLDYSLQCPYCHKKYHTGQKIKYEDHISSHTGETPYQCEQCGKGFGSKWKLTVHTRTHGEPTLPCQYCPQLYKTRKTLRNHQRKHHPEYVPGPKSQRWKTEGDSEPKFIGPELMYPCEPCGRVYRWKSCLIPHLKHRHKIILPRSADYPNMWTFEDYDRAYRF